MRRCLRSVVACAAVLLVGGRPAAAGTLLLFAAASLTDALQEIIPAYEAASGHRVTLAVGASSDLARQIHSGAPADVFFSSDVARVEELERAGLVTPGARRTVLSNRLAVVVPGGSRAHLAAAEDLRRLGRIALADPEAVPAGIYARAWLRGLGLWDVLRDRVVPTLDVRAALALVETEAADAAIVYRSDVAVARRVRVAFVVPREQGPPIAYALAPLAAAGPEAAALVRHLVGPAARAVYERHGFLARER
jgi:molybdate transport system substrate-binding protein